VCAANEKQAEQTQATAFFFFWIARNRKRLKQAESA
jgi:hypothetical protein